MRRTQSAVATDLAQPHRWATQGGWRSHPLSHRFRDGLTVENLLYTAIFVLAVLTRFWDLGSRALHHDESLHTYFSWIYAEGSGFRHNPLMHGPFLFHANALAYLLFGTSDYVSRVIPAVLGIIVVMLPWLLRGERLLGRWGALAASALLVFSPSILFYSRFIREDVHTLLGTMALMITVIRYVEKPEPRWAIAGGVAASYLLATKEVSFIVYFLIAVFLGAAIIHRVAPILFAVVAAAGIGFLVMSRVLHSLGAGPLPGIPWETPTFAEIMRFVGQLLRHPLIVAAIGIALLAIIVSVWILDRRRPKDRGWIDGVLGDAPERSTAAALHTMLTERQGLWIGLVAAAAIYVVLYTSLFTNMLGLASGTAGALGYWLGQQGVQRGEQPWYYYLLLLPQYEFVAVLLFPTSSVALAVSSVRRWQRSEPLDFRYYFRAFLIFWTLGLLAVLSWAGEKMPWLVTHLAAPMILLAASYIGDALGWLDRGRRTATRGERRASWLLGVGIVGTAAAAFLAMAWASAGPYVSDGPALQRSLRTGVLDYWWAVAYLPWLALAALLLVAARWLGWRRVFVTTTLFGTLALVLAQVHVAWRMTYREGDVPKDMLIYVQTTPDVPRVTDQLAQLSHELTGGMGMEILYDTGTQWPFNWYLRDFPNRRYIGGQLPPGQQAPVLLLSREVLTATIEQSLQDYSYQEYPMRWWFPEEETYRRFAYAPELKNESRQNYQDNERPPFSVFDVAASALDSLWSMRHPEQQAEMFRLVAYRELPAPIGSVGFRVYIRRDLLPYFNGIRY